MKNIILFSHSENTQHKVDTLQYVGTPSSSRAFFVLAMKVQSQISLLQKNRLGKYSFFTPDDLHFAVRCREQTG